jgi:hypothetical protein
MRNDCLFHFASSVAIVLIKSGRLGVEGMMDGMQREKCVSPKRAEKRADMLFQLLWLQFWVLREREGWGFK